MSGYEQYLLSYSASKNMLPLTSRCNVACVFCSHAHNPAGVNIYQIPPLSFEEVKNLAGFLTADEKIVIGESVTTINEGEPFTHPELLVILAYLRETFPETVISITTNGSLLTEKVVASLAHLGKIEINLSLNSATIQGRELLMKDRQSDTALACLALLAQYQIVYHGSIVAMPQLVGWEDIRYTCKMLATHHAQTIRIFIPGFTQYAPSVCQYSKAVYDEFWPNFLKIKAESVVPMTLEPHVPDNLLAEVEGVIADSPAAKAGIRGGDLIISINSLPVFSRAHAFARMLKTQQASILIARDGKQQLLQLVRAKEERPGVVMYHDMDYDLIETIKGFINAHPATAILVSSLAYPLWRSVYQEIAAVYEVPNDFFGGVIRCAGLLTVSDYQKVITQLAGEFQHVLLPQISFDMQGKDILGVAYTKLRTAATVHLL